MKYIKPMLLMMAFLLTWNSEVYSQNITDLIRNYEKCKSPQTCRANEFQLINIFLEKQNILDVLEEMPKNEDIKYEIISSNISYQNSKDYIFKIVIDNLSYLVILKQDVKNKKYSILPIIEKGFIYDLQTKDITGDGIEELFISGTETGGAKWTAIYKYKGGVMHLIWSGYIEESNIDKGVENKNLNSIFFYNLPGSKSKEIYYTVVSGIIDPKTKEFVTKEISKKIYKWSVQEFKFIEFKPNKKGNGVSKKEKEGSPLDKKEGMGNS